jgi:hypothetical protein
MKAVPDEDGWYLLPDGRKTSRACQWCGTPFIPNHKNHRRCGRDACKFAELKTDPERWARRLAQLREASVRYLDRHRDERNARRRASASSAPEPHVTPPPPLAGPWEAASPEAGTHLPGAWRELVFQPAPHRPIPHGHVTSIHGIVSRALGLDHSRTHADFVLAQAPVPSGWCVYLVDADAARRLSCAPMPGLHLEGRPWGVCFGPGVAIPRRPAPVAPGRYLVEVTTLSPVCIRRSSDGRTLVRITPTASSLRASLTWLEFLRRCGLAGRTLPPWCADAEVALLDQDTRRQSVETDGHWNAGDGSGHGHVVGWTGSVWLEVSAVALWLLRHAETVGLGGRVAAGFGQVRVRVSTETPRPCEAG